jgi:cardiolipin synthase
MRLDPGRNPLPRLFARWRRAQHGDSPLVYVRRPSRLRRHTAVRPLRGGGESFPAMLGAIALARETVELEMYTMRSDATGVAFRDALVERARAGIAVRVLIDAVGSIGLSESFLAPLRGSGVRVAVFHPVAPWRARAGLNRRDHKKILVVDELVGFTGGINLSDQYLPSERGGEGWLDWHARVDGPAVRDLTRSFRRTWKRAVGERLPDPRVPPPHRGRNVLGVEVVDNLGVRSRWRMHRAYLHAIAAAQREICILNAYFIPELSLRRALARAVERGVSVRVIVPSTSDVPAVRHASRHLYKRLLQSGVRILEWRGTMMHAKAGVIDGVWSTIGSYNLDRRSLLHNLEISLVCLDDVLGGALRDEFENEAARCREVQLDDLEQIPPLQRLAQWFWYQLRSWL